MFLYVTFAVNAMRIFGNNRKIIVNNWTISQELWNKNFEHNSLWLKDLVETNRAITC